MLYCRDKGSMNSVASRGETAGYPLSASSIVVSRFTPDCNPELANQLWAKRGGEPLWIKTFAGQDGQPTYERTASPTLVLEPLPGLLAGRHRALRTANSDVLIFLDDDVTLGPDWLKNILDPFGEPDIHFVGCRYLPHYEHEPPSWMGGLWGESGVGFRTLSQLSLLDGGESSRVYQPTLVWGLCFAVRRETVMKLGGFHPDGYPWEMRRFRGDGETGLALKAAALGLKAFYQGRTHVWHRVPTSRMTPEYFETRAFLQGISNSYTQIRLEGRVPPAQERSWKDHLRPAKWKIERALISRKPTTNGVHLLMARAHWAGIQFHQKEVRNDAKLLTWVLKSDYFDYRLPIGWEQYLNPES